MSKETTQAETPAPQHHSIGESDDLRTVVGMLLGTIQRQRKWLKSSLARDEAIEFDNAVEAVRAVWADTPPPERHLMVVWTSQYQLDEALNCGVGFIYGEEGKPEKADIPLMRLADGGPASSDNLPLFGELPSPSPFTRKAGHSAADAVAKIAQVASGVGFQANVPALDIAGQILSILAANPEHIDRFMVEGTELFLDGTFNYENGSLTYRAMNGMILSPSVIREKKGQQQ